MVEHHQWDWHEPRVQVRALPLRPAQGRHDLDQVHLVDAGEHPRHHMELRCVTLLLRGRCLGFAIVSCLLFIVCCLLFVFCNNFVARGVMLGVLAVAVLGVRIVSLYML